MTIYVNFNIDPPCRVSCFADDPECVSQFISGKPGPLRRVCLCMKESSGLQFIILIYVLLLLAFWCFCVPGNGFTLSVRVHHFYPTDGGGVAPCHPPPGYGVSLASSLMYSIVSPYDSIYGFSGSLRLPHAGYCCFSTIIVTPGCFRYVVPCSRCSGDRTLCRAVRCPSFPGVEPPVISGGSYQLLLYLYIYIFFFCSYALSGLSMLWP